ncbi:MAG: restriction endonuclease [Candidatus Promineifilaceae bacterium]
MTIRRSLFPFFSSPHKPVLRRFTRAAQRQTFNLAGYFNEIVIAGLLTAAFLAWVIYRWIWTPIWFNALPQTGVEVFDLLEFGSAVAILTLWAFIIWWRANNRPKAPSVSAIYTLDPYEFEAYVAELFRKKGYTVKQRGGAGDMGVDLEITRRNERKSAIVQCKRYRNTVGPNTVRELYGTFRHEKVNHAFLVTTAKISKGARSWAEGKPMTLIDGDALVVLAHKYDLKVPS